MASVVEQVVASFLAQGEGTEKKLMATKQRAKLSLVVDEHGVEGLVKVLELAAIPNKDPALRKSLFTTAVTKIVEPADVWTLYPVVRGWLEGAVSVEDADAAALVVSRMFKDEAIASAHVSDLVDCNMLATRKSATTKALVGKLASVMKRIPTEEAKAYNQQLAAGLIEFLATTPITPDNATARSSVNLALLTTARTADGFGLLKAHVPRIIEMAMEGEPALLSKLRGCKEPEALAAMAENMAGIMSVLRYEPPSRSQKTVQKMFLLHTVAAVAVHHPASIVPFLQDPLRSFLPESASAIFSIYQAVLKGCPELATTAAEWMIPEIVATIHANPKHMVYGVNVLASFGLASQALSEQVLKIIFGFFADPPGGPAFESFMPHTLMAVQVAAKQHRDSLTPYIGKVKELAEKPGTVGSVATKIMDEYQGLSLSSLDKRVREISALWQQLGLEADDPLLDAAEEVAESNKEIPKFDCMLSYQWDSQTTVLRLRDSLRARGFTVWCDVEQMSGSIYRKMAEAVLGSTVVLPCLTEKYEASDNCKRELAFAADRKRSIIPLRLGPAELTWSALITAGALYFFVGDKETSDDDAWEAMVSAVANELTIAIDMVKAGKARTPQIPEPKAGETPKAEQPAPPAAKAAAAAAAAAAAVATAAAQDVAAVAAEAVQHRTTEALAMLQAPDTRNRWQDVPAEISELIGGPREAARTQTHSWVFSPMCAAALGHLQGLSTQCGHLRNHMGPHIYDEAMKELKSRAAAWAAVNPSAEADVFDRRPHVRQQVQQAILEWDDGAVTLLDGLGAYTDTVCEALAQAESGMQNAGRGQRQQSTGRPTTTTPTTPPQAEIQCLFCDYECPPGDQMAQHYRSQRDHALFGSTTLCTITRSDVWRCPTCAHPYGADEYMEHVAGCNPQVVKKVCPVSGCGKSDHHAPQPFNTGTQLAEHMRSDHTPEEMESAFDFGPTHQGDSPKDLLARFCKRFSRASYARTPTLPRTRTSNGFLARWWCRSWTGCRVPLAPTLASRHGVD
eukprot:m.447085 g.447085  ORF g.447085 m.447085 type:complete len:1022 (+) comp20313_c5_seq9:65-3130(+)